MHDVHVLLSVNEVSGSTMCQSCLDELMFDCIVCVMQHPKMRAEHLVSSRHPVVLLLLLLTFVHACLNPNILKLLGLFML